LETFPPKSTWIACGLHLGGKLCAKATKLAVPVSGISFKFRKLKMLRELQGDRMNCLQAKTTT
jgi:hypothetical protein